MQTHERVMHLHDKATRGLKLTAEEQADLEAWYVEQDAAEQQLLDAVGTTSPLGVIHEQVAETVAQLHITTQRIEDLISGNTLLRREIATLQQRLSQRNTPVT